MNVELPIQARVAVHVFLIHDGQGRLTWGYISFWVLQYLESCSVCGGPGAERTVTCLHQNLYMCEQQNTKPQGEHSASFSIDTPYQP